jgi:hypothetical protein
MAISRQLQSPRVSQFAWINRLPVLEASNAACAVATHGRTHRSLGQRDPPEKRAWTFPSSYDRVTTIVHEPHLTRRIHQLVVVAILRSQTETIVGLPNPSL